MRAVFLDRGSVDVDDLDLTALRSATADWTFHDETAPEQVRDRVADAEIVVTNKVVLDGETLADARQLHLVCVAATGTNNVDLEAARHREIAVSNVRAYATPSVVQHVFSLILTLTRHLDEYRDALAAGRWQRSPHFCLLDYPIRELDGKVLGIVGYGELGRAVAEAARAFGMDVRIAARPGGEDRRSGRVPLDTLLAEADVLSLHCPLTEHTRNLIGARELGLMKSDALLINAARGGIVDEPALARALRDGAIGGAGVDVLTEEPPRHGNPLLDEDLLNLLVTPHVAWASRESRQRLVDEVARNIEAFRRGESRNRVT